MFLFSLFLYFLMYLISFHLVMNSDDWFLIWLGLEVNMIMFIIFIYNQYDMNSFELCLKYFFIQSLGSGMFMGMFYLGMENLKSAVCLIMSYKIGAGPFFFWFPSLSMMVFWVFYFVLLTFQKFIPLILMNVFMDYLMVLIGLMSLFIGVFGSFNQNNLKRLLAYFFIFHLGWIIMCNMTGDFAWMMYMFMYMLMLGPLVFFLKYNNVVFLGELIKLKYMFFFMFLMLSMGGMPPMLGFFVKWYALSVMKFLSYYVFLVLVILSVVMFYIYFRLLYDYLLDGVQNSFWLKWDNKINMKYYWVDILSSLGFLLGSMFMVFIII
uniref:NADH-ubiquinone oxidoreductase chain 2 n=1 Tax=Oxytate striatipes TaxID=1112455 RepID=A0A0U1XJZ5_OXYST|nr:NADH dehydrogenase subunit 2 [Oxytate striatipes]AIT96917.1 NADH dehydrogenase subunit 2 [Oxytate striatipes]